VSNVALVDSQTGNIGRVGYRIGSDGKKERYFKKSGNVVERDHKLG
jgi:ribosomal protein L24